MILYASMMFMEEKAVNRKAATEKVVKTNLIPISKELS